MYAHSTPSISPDLHTPAEERDAEVQATTLGDLNRRARNWLIGLTLLLVLIWVGIGVGIGAAQRGADPSIRPSVTRLAPEIRDRQQQQSTQENLGSEGPRS